MELLSAIIIGTLPFLLIFVLVGLVASLISPLTSRQFIAVAVAMTLSMGAFVLMLVPWIETYLQHSVAP